jgi:Fe-S oxidoreductase
VTRDEQHLTRGRANTLRLALSGQLGADAFTSDALYDALDLCVSCKGCRRECPTGVDMAKMKIEFLYHYRKRHGLTLKDRAIAYLPRYAPWAARLAPLANVLAAAAKPLLGFASERRLPQWRRDGFATDRTDGNAVEQPSAVLPHPDPLAKGAGSDTLLPSGEGMRMRENAPREVVLFIDTFTRYFEPENAHAARAVLQAAGFVVHLPRAARESRPLCCGRTFLASGLVNEASREARRTLAALEPYLDRGLDVVGIEPSCVLGMRDEFISMLPGGEAAELALRALTFEEFVAREDVAERLQPRLGRAPYPRALLHGHCHQKAFAVMPAVERALRLVPALEVETIESSCCGMAGSFGYEAKHYDVSMRMAELSLLPRVRASGADTMIVADGTSCRHQIREGAAREAVHVARVLAQALD